MEYCPPSDPEDNDFDADTFDLYGLNNPIQVWDFDHEEVRRTYIRLQPLAAAHPDVEPNTVQPDQNLLLPEEDHMPERPASPETPEQPVSAESVDLPRDPPSPDPASQSESDNENTDPPQATDFPDPPPDISDQESTLSSPPNSSDEETDVEIDLLDNDDDFGIPLERPPSRPMINCHYDVEHELDYELGWEWLQSDPGPMIAPYNGFRQCLLDPSKKKPEDFFCALFEDRMFTVMADMTNVYARNRIQSK